MRKRVGEEEGGMRKRVGHLRDFILLLQSATTQFPVPQPSLPQLGFRFEDLEGLFIGSNG
jgi:hypothetical protein